MDFVISQNLQRLDGWAGVAFGRIRTGIGAILAGSACTLSSSSISRMRDGSSRIAYNRGPAHQPGRAGSPADRHAASLTPETPANPEAVTLRSSPAKRVRPLYPRSGVAPPQASTKPPARRAATWRFAVDNLRNTSGESGAIFCARLRNSTDFSHCPSPARIRAKACRASIDAGFKSTARSRSFCARATSPLRSRARPSAKNTSVDGGCCFSAIWSSVSASLTRSKSSRTSAKSTRSRGFFSARLVTSAPSTWASGILPKPR